MVQNSNERDAFGLKDGQMFGTMRKDFPLGTQFALIALSPDGRYTVHCSEQMKPFESRLYNEDTKNEAIAAITRKRSCPTTTEFRLPSLSMFPRAPAGSMISTLEEGTTMDDVASGAGRPRKKQRRAISEPMPSAPAESASSSSASASSSSSSSSSSSFPMAVAEPAVSAAEQQLALLPPVALEQLPEDEVQSLDKGKGKAIATDPENSNPSTGEKRTNEEGEETEEKSIALRIGDTEAVTNYLVTRFVQIQQLDCRALAKSWIKAVEPRKQSHSPYNKGDATRPYWWPLHVPHREPDHLLRSHRVEVLVSILRNTGIDMAELRSATNGSRGVRPRQKELLSEVCDVVGLERRFMKGQLDQDHIVYVVPFTKLTKRKPRAPKAPAAGKVTKQPRQPRRAAAVTARRRRVLVNRIAPTTSLPPQVKEEDEMEAEAGSSQLPEPLTLPSSSQPQQVVLTASSSRTAHSPVPQTQSAVKRRQSADTIRSLDPAVERHSPANESRSSFGWPSPESAVSAPVFAMSHPHSPLSLQAPAPESEMIPIPRPSMFTPVLPPHIPSTEVADLPMLPPNDSELDFGVSAEQYNCNTGDAYINYAIAGGQFQNINFPGSFGDYQ
ncbi:hypothetical protein TWF696_005489 [Orbilia brochopaga]|uniref:Subtelomeric hrmA-associated cluster protein AFUB-079030/YDR124W-like helical bundle domain-containing protein n=1 Tax=Orbilia brochopaga TaxID=3140254 RepID=A0AAV9V122_9PEZI